MFCLITKSKSFVVIILKHHFWCDLLLSLQKLYLGLVFNKDCNFDGIFVNPENAVRQDCRANVFKGEDYNFFHIANSNPNPG